MDFHCIHVYERAGHGSLSFVSIASSTVNSVTAPNPSVAWVAAPTVAGRSLVTGVTLGSNPHTYDICVVPIVPYDHKYEISLRWGFLNCGGLDPHTNDICRHEGVWAFDDLCG
ncbi:hypothetical protein PoB_007658000 [Plakobranchus ocellatus]|uniref:Uncharacterized protein n=1 Tax=Plakobranchus ocellatus TaxID=259542 RepID=A0AAV4E1D4_9GAST|nr:hypothetical protein PoB_007658000 [Plakobranchus ocellatus]